MFLFVILFVSFFTCKDNVLFCLRNFIFDDLQGFFRRKLFFVLKSANFIDEIPVQTRKSMSWLTDFSYMCEGFRKNVYICKTLFIYSTL